MFIFLNNEEILFLFQLYQDLKNDLLFQNFGLVWPIIYSHRFLINTFIMPLQMILYVNKG